MNSVRNNRSPSKGKLVKQISNRSKLLDYQPSRMLHIPNSIKSAFSSPLLHILDGSKTDEEKVNTKKKKKHRSALSLNQRTSEKMSFNTLLSTKKAVYSHIKNASDIENISERIFKYNDYKIKRRFTSYEVIRSRYESKCVRRRYRPRSKSDPLMLPFTHRMYRTLECEYRPSTTNIFTLMFNDSIHMHKNVIESRVHDESVDFRYLFNDSESDDESLV